MQTKHLESDPPAPPPAAALDGPRVGAVGLVEPKSEIVAVAATVPGLVTRVFVQPNADVRRGDPLFALDDRDLAAEKSLRAAALAAAEQRLGRLEHMPRPEEVLPARARVAAAKAGADDARTQFELMESVTDPRAIRRDELNQRRFRAAFAQAEFERAQAELDLLLAGAWDQDLSVARREVELARAGLSRIDAELERLVTRAPIDGAILKLDVREGEYAPTGQLARPLVLMGGGTICVRVDVNEEDAWRVDIAREGEALPRGQAQTHLALRFVRFEPHVIPKQSLSGFATERVDTRVRQAIYEIVDDASAVSMGEQVDVFLPALADPAAAVRSTP
jgi:multidrug efflux pump subunit AcrA (membrane-fusion protein)